MKRLFHWSALVSGLTLLLLMAFAIKPASVSAHVLQQDGDVSAVLHIRPDDNPIAGADTSISLEFSSADPNFNLDNYSVDVSLQASDAASASSTVPLIPDGPKSSFGNATINFPQTGVYNVIARGTPNANGKGFKLTYIVRVEQNGTGGVGNTVDSSAFDIAMICLASFGLLIIIARYQIIKGGRYVS